MALRTVALCDGKYIGIETIFTVINGRQINIPEKLKELRVKSRNNELFCPYGCGSNLILVAGDRNLHEQHFRLKSGDHNQGCNANTEGRVSLNLKIALKCWLDDKLKANDIESRVQIQAVDNINREYEFSFLSREKKIALSYFYEKENITDEKIENLNCNSHGIRVIYVVDFINGGCNGQYPERLMKIQEKQGYCLLLSIENDDYYSASMEAIFFTKNIDGLWEEVQFAYGSLADFYLGDTGEVIFDGKTVDAMKMEVEEQYKNKIEFERVRRLEEKTRRREEQRKEQEESEKERIRLAEEAAQRRAELEKKRRLEEEQRQIENQRFAEEFRRKIESYTDNMIG